MSEAPAAAGEAGADAHSAPRLPSFDADRGWRLHPQVAVRPEPFGALLYHFGTRKLSFLKNRTIVSLVESLGEHDSVRSACRAAGIDDAAQVRYVQALATLAGSKMLVPQDHDRERQENS